MITLKCLTILFIYLSLLFSVYGQEPSWYEQLKQLKPLESTKEDVERIFNDAKLEKSFVDKGTGVGFYKTSNGKFSVYYSAGNCSNDWKADYDVEKGKVIEIFYSANKLTNISRFKIDLTGFSKEKEDDNPTLHYFNKELGIDYSTERGKLKSITLFPASKYNNLKCKIPTIDKLNSFVLCDTIENGWKGIKALKTDKATVDKLLGKPEIDDNGYAGYSTDDAFIEVNFSTAPCENDQYERGKYKVPKETALDYTVRLKKKIKLSEFRYNQEKYEKDTSGDLKSSADYYNPNDEITIGVYIQEGTEYVTDIHFGINKKDAELFKCEEINDLK